MRLVPAAALVTLALLAVPLTRFLSAAPAVAIKLAVDLTVAAINRANIQGTTSEQAVP